MTSPSERPVIVATPYPEGSCAAIARALDRSGQLECYATSLATSASLARHSDRVPFLGSKVRRTLEKRVPDGISPKRIVSVGNGPELVHLALRATGVWLPRTSQAMYWAKHCFDRKFAVQIASGLCGSKSAAVVGISGSCSETFEAARSIGMFTVLNCVNSHPGTQNALLVSLAGLRPGHPELVTANVARRVEKEMRLADLILVPSRFVQCQLVDAGIPMRAIRMVRYGTDLSKFDANRRLVRTSQPLQLLFVGQVGYRKGLPTLLAAVSSLGQDVQLTIVGPVTSSDILQSLPSNTTYAGSRAHDRLPDMMARADLFVLPSYEDAFPLAVLEAMACATPPLVTKNVGSSEIVVSGKSGFVVPAGDAEAIVGVVRQVIADPEMLVAMGSAAQNTVASSHTWLDYGSEVVSILNEARSSH